MFRLSKNKASSKSAADTRFEFRFSHFKALQVPKGWEKLFVSVVSVESGKAIAKSSKVLVRNGSCQWSDCFSEFVLFPGDNSSKEIDECLLKLIVAMGSSRSSILGEATVNLASYVSSNAESPLSLKLSKCNHGTVLHVTVQCLTPRTKTRDRESSETDSHSKAMNENKHDVAIKSNGSDCSYVHSVGSSSLEDLESTLSPGEVETRATSFSESVSNCSYTSAEGSTGRGNISPKSNDGQIQAGRHDSNSSRKSASNNDYHANNSSPSNHSAFSSLSVQECSTPSSKMTNLSNNRPEGAEDTSEELRAQAKMWEMNARKLMGDLDMLRREFSDQSKKLAGLEMDLSTANVDRDSLKKEVEDLKLLLEDPILRHTALEGSISQGDIPDIEKALKDELKFQRESNADLSLQLKRSQEANAELVSLLQELEETLQQRKVETDNLSSLPSRFSEMERSFQLSIEENKSLTNQLEQLEKSKKNLLIKVQELEQSLEDKIHDTAHQKSPNDKTLSDVEMEYESKLSAKEEEILCLKAKLSESLPESNYSETVSRHIEEADLMREIELLKEKVQELEMDCNELTEENLELLFKLKEAKKNPKDGGLKDRSFASFESENNLFRIFPSENMLQGKHTKNISVDDNVPTKEVEALKLDPEVRISDLNMEVINKTSEIANLEATLSSKEKEIGVLQKHLTELEGKVNDLERENFQLQEQMEIFTKESDTDSKFLYHLQNDSATLNKNIESHVSASETLTRKSLELEGKHKLELHISEIEQENEQLLRQISVLEAHLGDLTNEKESYLSELESSKSQAARLREEMLKMKSEMDYSKEDSKQREQYCSLLGVRLQESERRFADICGKVVILEKKFSSIQEDIASKEKHLALELDGFIDENRKHMEQGQSLLNQMQTEKMVEIQSLEKEIENLSMKLAATYDEKELIASKALLEVSTLRTDKAKLESAFEEVQSKLSLSKTEVNGMHTEYEQKLKDLTTELLDLKMEKQMLMNEHEKLLKVVEDSKSRELKLKSTINALELKLTVTQYERQKFMDESGNLKLQLQQTSQFENEIVALRNELNSANSEKKRLETSLSLASEVCKDLEAEKASFEIKISTLEKVVSELEDCKRTRSSLEERLMQLESDLKVREETRCVQESELSQVKRINRQHQQTLQLLEQEKVELQKKVQAIEEELKLLKEQKRNQASKLNRKVLPVHEDMKTAKNSAVKNTTPYRSTRKKPSTLKNERENMKDQLDLRYSSKNQSEVEVETEHGILDESIDAVEIDPVSTIQSLDSSLAEATETNNIHEDQLTRSQGHANGSIKSMGEGELVTKEKFERTKSMLEAELSDIQERYFHMSLKYAEVEAEREELVMKLKEVRNKKGWFS
ncbi:uncharacterized protein LOC107476250 [Arachis duranensis]|uniref:Uncharacterized protein LOC107476250 n=1 Tax=Arachis duranensis TaxID=130453 RepID=A0A6P5N508_ARADU|nr:uncharacterized protein LOC107476250 [Arachis duranensis]